MVKKVVLSSDSEDNGPDNNEQKLSDSPDAAPQALSKSAKAQAK